LAEKRAQTEQKTASKTWLRATCVFLPKRVCSAAYVVVYFNHGKRKQGTSPFAVIEP